MYLLVKLLQEPWQNILITFIAVLLGLGISSLYLVPAILEQKYINIDYQLGTNNGFLSFDIHYLFEEGRKYMGSREYLVIFRKNILATIVLTIIACLCSIKNRKVLRVILGWFALTIIVFFMYTNLSEFIWYSSKILLKTQGTWRILGILFFAQAVMLSLTTKIILDSSSWKLKLFVLVIISSLFLSNFEYSYTLSRKLPNLNQPTKGVVPLKEWFEIALFDNYSEKSVDVPEYRPRLLDQTFDINAREYYPKNSQGIYIPEVRGGKAYFPVPKLNESKVSVVEGKADIEIKNWSSYTREFTINTIEPLDIRIRTYYYPAWNLEINHRSYDIQMLKDGTIGFNLQPGYYQGKLTYQLTPAFKLGLFCSGLSLITTILIYRTQVLHLIKQRYSIFRANDVQGE